MRNDTKKYRQKAIGLADQQGVVDEAKCLSFGQAVSMAQAIFRENALLCIEPNLPQARLTELNYCPVGETYTVAHALRDYIEWKRISAAPNSIYRILSVVNRHVLPWLGPIGADELTTEHIRTCMTRVLETCPHPGKRDLAIPQRIEILDSETLRKRKHSVNGLVLALRGALKLAWQNRKTENDRIWRTLELYPREHRPRMHHLSTRECRRLLRQCDSDLRKLVMGALYTGCRSIELFKMCAGDVGRDGFGIYVFSPKTSTSRVIFLPDEAMAFFLKLAEGKKPDDLLFTIAKGTPWNTSYYRRFRKAVVEASLPKGFSFHGLRHTYASQLVQAGAPLSVVAEQLGHVNTTMVCRTYAHIAPQIREAEVRQRFVTFKTKSSAQLTAAEKKLLQIWRKNHDVPNMRSYARIADMKSVRNVAKIF
jgi:integrase